MVKVTDWSIKISSNRCPDCALGKCGNPKHPEFSAAKHPACSIEKCPVKADSEEDGDDDHS